MQRDVRAYLWDIDQAARSIERFIDRLDIEAYARNEIVHAAVERKFEIIGESLSQLAKRDPSWRLVYRELTKSWHFETS
jgi:uncharacterized protein with HEPN domain